MIDFLRAWPTMIAAVDSIAVVQVGLVDVALVEPGEEAEVADDLLDSLQAVARAAEQALDVLQGVGHVDLVAERRGSVRPARAGRAAIRSSASLVEGEQVAHLADVAAEHGDVVGDERDRVVDLVRDAGHDLAEAGELLRLHELALRLLQRRVRLAFGLGHLLEPDVLRDELLLGPLPLGDVPEDPLHADDLALRRRAAAS